MDQMKEAYERMGLPEDATKEQLDDRYTLLMRQTRSHQRREPDRAEEIEAEFSEITKAYKFILEEETRKSLEEMNQKRYGKYKKFAGTAEKTDHFFRYYKFHVLGGVALIGVLIYIVISIFNHQAEKERLASLPPVDLEVMFLGSYMNKDGGQDLTPIEDAILAQFPEWKRVTVTMNYVPPLDSNNPQDAAMLQKALLVLSTERPDLYIMDQTAYDWVGNQGMVRPLEAEVEGVWKDLLTPEQLVKGTNEEDGSEHVYAVDILGSTMSEELPVLKKDMFAGIREGTERDANAQLFIKQYLESSK
ncbi:molecular chaperone DnaJ [Paenibacillus glucanolyticus]|uniref:Molecular chaperone DnaJ n=1 Tax=Paenibacillus glucanolyticus TaxID=59843 RepID=A0A163FIW2_9BACL|nr:J domain-containing protein [Paenibacillus glucanolyticus]KZS44421.1 molecular chaperone DnaJ [Paenibacillus glucanolyticus]